MNEAIALAFAAAVPFLCLGLLLWLARLEDTLTDGLISPQSRPEPAPAPAAAPATVTNAPATAVSDGGPAAVAAA